MIGSQKNGADRVTKEKALKSVKKADEEMDEKRAQAQTLFSGGFILLVLIVATFIFLIPSKALPEKFSENAFCPRSGNTARKVLFLKRWF